MAPYIRLPRQNNSTNTNPGTSGDSTSNDASSFMDKYSKEIYISLAVLGVLILSYFLWAGSTNRLFYPPFNQKRCNECKKGISKEKKEEEDYFKSSADAENSKGWICKSCQEKLEEKMLNDELEKEEEKGKKIKSKSKFHIKEKSKIKSKKNIEDISEDELDSSDEEEEEVVIETVKKVKKVERDLPKIEKRKSRPPPLKKRYEEESDSDDYDSSDEEDVRGKAGGKVKVRSKA
ncbi:uncharacterized protein I206_105816 [Kwoniella pini CBS 10737]|uniref:Uncharacterized protein n=1 Tax=Kwoniella pini CBS 10737 TaxID=1296096 RepID=A0A1B9I083_9TREE|nr:uncharacterized protein I206_04636 [Kwoniella pini CBS 10737]OCF48949.1 hypothetical protein I206_04636 [Kwoniella pini CBS 10737]